MNLSKREERSFSINPADGQALALAMGLPESWAKKAAPFLRKGALRVVALVIVRFTRHHDSQMAAAIAFYGFLSIFPLLLLLAALASHFLATEQVQTAVMQLTSRYLPAAADVVLDNIKLLSAQRQSMGLFAAIGLLWAASGVFSTLIIAIRRAWSEENMPVFWLQRLSSILIVIIIILLFFAIMTFGTVLHVLTDVYLPYVPLIGAQLGRILRWGSGLVPPLLNLFLFWVLYKSVPAEHVLDRSALAGASIAALGIESLRWGFIWYLGNLARYGLVYGSVSAIVVLLIWSYLVAFIILVGAELVAVCSALAGLQRENVPALPSLGEIESKALRRDHAVKQSRKDS